MPKNDGQDALDLLRGDRARWLAELEKKASPSAATTS